MSKAFREPIGDATDKIDINSSSRSEESKKRNSHNENLYDVIERCRKEQISHMQEIIDSMRADGMDTSVLDSIQADSIKELKEFETTRVLHKR